MCVEFSADETAYAGYAQLMISDGRCIRNKVVCTGVQKYKYMVVDFCF